LVSPVQSPPLRSLGLTILSQCTQTGRLTNLMPRTTRRRVLSLTTQFLLLGAGVMLIVQRGMDLFAE